MKYDICCQHKLALTPFKSHPAAVQPLLDAFPRYWPFFFIVMITFYVLLVSVLSSEVVLHTQLVSMLAFHCIHQLSTSFVLKTLSSSVLIHSVSVSEACVSLFSFILFFLKNAGFRFHYKNAKGSLSSRVHTLSEMMGKSNHFRAEWLM